LPSTLIQDAQSRDDDVLDPQAIAEAVLEEARVFALNMRFDNPVIQTLDEKLAYLTAIDPLPTAEQLASAIERIFWASQLSEEQRPTRVRLSIVPAAAEEDAQGPASSLDFIRFDRDVPLTSERIKKLCQAHDPETSFLGLRFLESGPVVHGIGALLSRDHSPGYFTVRSLSAGVLDFSWNVAHLARFAQGQLDVLSTAVLGADLVLPWVSEVFDEFGMALVLVPAARAIAAHGHGGSLWFVHSHAADKVHCQLGYPVVEQAPLAERSPQSPMRRAFARAVGRLSAIDGAVVLTARAQLLGFGAFVNLDPNQQVVRFDSFGRGEVVSAADTGGGRHRSAVSFCAQHVPSLALVMSEDRGLSLVRHRVGEDLPEIVRISPLGIEIMRAVEEYS
jgi:hypothetical protein